MQPIKNAYSLDFDSITKKLETSSEGLTQEEVIRRQKIFGKNTIEEKEFSYVRLFLRQFHNILVYVLFVAALISFFTQKYVDFFVIIALVMVNSIISFWQEIKAHVSIKALKKLTASKETVVRNGKSEVVLSQELVPGDIVILGEGDIVSADIRVHSSNALFVDESSLTGESLPVLKDHTVVHEEKTPVQEQKNMLFAGTTVVRGKASGVVVSTGKDTLFATIAETSQEDAPVSPLTKAMSYFAKGYLYFLLVLFSLIGFVGIYQKRNFLDITYILIAELVSAVPEGLPIVVTLVLVVGALALSRKKTLIRYLPAVETLGSATILAIDKTGTITEGSVRVEDFFAYDEQQLKQCIALASDYSKENFDPIEIALYEWSDTVDNLQKTYPRVWSYPFDVKMRLMASVNKVDDKKKIFIKGALEAIEKFDSDEKRKEEIREKVHHMSQQGLRVLVFAEGDFISEDPNKWTAKIVGVVGFLDPAKEGVKQAVIAAKEAKIHILMITGDHPTTAKALAKDVHIFHDNDDVITGEEIDSMDDEALYHALKKATVLARSLPEHKYRVVKLLQKYKQIVAVSGDGVNDVPALKVADLGIAMGKGTEAAISVSKMVIKDNNLSVIIGAIRNGRIIADNIRKVIYYLLSCALQEISLISLAILSNLPLPLFPIQILWINLVTDGVQDKTFAFAKEEQNVMLRPPRSPIKQFFDKWQIYRVLTFGFVMGAVTLFFFRYLLQIFPYEKTVSIIFTGVVIMQWLNGIQAQKENEPFLKNWKRSFTINPLIYAGIALGILLQMIAVFWGRTWMQTTPLSLAEWKYPLIMAFLSFFIVEIRKWIEFLFLKRKNNKNIEKSVSI